MPVFENGEIRFLARADKKYDNVEVRVVTKSGSDRSCVKPLPDQFVYLTREAGKRNEKPIPAESYIPEFQNQEKKDYVAVKLGTVSKGETMFSLKPAAPPPSGKTYLVEFVVGKKGGR
ncbi:MAG: hypothetical protein ISN29_07890 [Gammaproteobacteria bacterium AqS3]|nr:hypothetical protein [Gammaproteobacteria bacterium AqS3]